MQNEYIRIESDDFMQDRYMITIQVEGYPKTTAYLEDDLTGLTLESAQALIKEVEAEEREANPQNKIIVVKGGF
jgi:hypothetical protein